MDRRKRLRTCKAGCLAAAPALLLAAAAEPGQEKLRVETQMEFRNEIVLVAEPAVPGCQAHMTLEYLQKDTLASIEGQIENDDCRASSGTYAYEVRFRDQQGEIHTLLSERAWARDDGEPVPFSQEVYIGENADLVRVRARGVDCVCAAAEGADTTEESQPGEQP